jgi:putative acetyltransferase
VSFTLRHAEIPDGPVVRDFIFDILRSYGITPEPAGLDADVMEIGIPNNGALAEIVADVDGDAVGFVALSGKMEGVGWVSKLFVKPEHRRGGIGRALLARLIDEARSRGLTRLGLQTRTIFREAVSLYEATGWTRGAAPDVDGPDRTYWLTLG